MTVLSIANFVSVSLTQTPSGLDVPNVNSLMLFTTETPGNSDNYRTYLSARDVATDYGSSSVTYEMASAIFSQAPNILSGDGRLVIAPMKGNGDDTVPAVSATSGYFTTANISANLAALIAVDDGDLKVTLDGVVINLANLDFTGATTLAGIAEVLQARLPNAICSATSTTITVKSKKVGADADVVLAQYAGSGTDLSGAGLLNTAAGTATSGADSSGETLVEAITRLSSQVQFIPMITNLLMEDDAVEAAATAIQALDIIWFYDFASTSDIAGVATTIAEAEETHTRCLMYTPDLTESNLMKSAYAGRACSVNFAGSATTQTMNLKSLATISPDDGLNQTLLDACDTAGVDVYGSFGGVSVVKDVGGNDYFDNVYNSLWFKLAIQTAGFNYLRQTNTKVPQTEAGMDGLKGAYGRVCDQAVNNGMIAPGEWTSSETFGNPDDFRRNIRDKGYYIYSTPIALQSAVDRENRIAPVVQIAIKLAGAIHKSNVIVVVNP
jgi:hypothetical protein